MRRPGGAVLEANVARLLRHAYVPCLPRPAFRERLAAEWRAEHARVSARRRGAAIVAREDPELRRLRGRPPSWPLVAALAAALALALGTRILRLGPPPARPTADALFARGEVALRRGDLDWQALAVGSDGLLLEDRPVEVRTPAERGLRVVAADGTLVLGERTRASLAPRAGGLDVRLEGSLVAERAGAGGAWELGDGARSVRLEHGRLELVLRPGEARARLERGAASASMDGREAALPAGAWHALDGAPPLAAGAAGEPARRPLGVPPEAPDEPVPDEPSGGDAPAALVGRVVDAASGEALEAFEIGLLPDRRGNEFHEAEVRSFASPDGSFRREDRPAGTYHVWVHAEGHAMGHAGPVDFDGETTLDVGTIALERGGGLRGFLVDENGAAVADALVLSERDTPSLGLSLAPEQAPEWLPAAATSRSDGSFELPRLRAGEHLLRISGQGRAPRWARASVEAGATTTLAPITLVAGARLSGRAERPDGTPHAGAYLVVTRMDEAGHRLSSFALTQTDAEGRYAVGGLPQGELLAIFLGDGHGRPEVRPVTVRSGQTTTLDFLAAKRGTRVHGTILQADGTPLADTNLTIFERGRVHEDDWQATATDAAGGYAFEGVAPGAYALVQVDSFGRGLSLIARGEVPDWPEHEWNVRRDPFAVEGAALDDASGEPLAGAIVILERLDDEEELFAGFATSSADGRFALRGLPGGRYRLTSYATDGEHGFEPGAPFLLDGAAPRHEAVLRHVPGGAVEVRVVDGAGQPLPGAMVTFLDEHGRVFSFDRTPRTDARGVHVASGVRPGRYRVCAELAEARGCVDVETSAGHRELLRIRLDAAGAEAAPSAPNETQEER